MTFILFQIKKTSKILYSKSDKALHVLYGKVRNLRSQKSLDYKVIKVVFREVQRNYPHEWLILLELYELVYNKDITLATEVYSQLIKLKKNKDLDQLICDGLDLIKK